MARMHFLDGAESIGGNKLLLTDAGTRLLFDFGTNFSAEDAFFDYDPWVKSSRSAFAKRFASLRALGLLMDLPGAKDAYFSEHVTSEAKFEALPDPGVQGLFLTHAHHDHDGNVPFLSPKIPLFGTPETLCFFCQKWVNDYLGKDGVLRNHYANNEHWRKALSGFVPLTHNKPVSIGKTLVTPLRVDHSIPGACGFLITTSGGKLVAFTGDYRLHGTQERRKLSEAFIKTVTRKGPVDLLITEGTNIDEYSNEREEA
jgi:ribonuclease J